MDDNSRKQVVDHLDELRQRVEARKGGDKEANRPVLDEVDAVRSLVSEERADRQSAHAAASGLEQRLLAWEAEHPELVALANRVVRALEDAGL